jgi:lysozyme family protein
MANFDLAIPVILSHEGTPTNYWVDDPDDPGGQTCWGISMLMIRREGITAQDLGIASLDAPECLKAVQLDRIRWVYKKFFWDRYGYGSIADQRVATKVFDGAVNFGPARAAVMAQRVAKAVSPNLQVDGAFGPASLAAVNAMEPDAFLAGFRKQQEDYYNLRAATNPKLRKFLHAWLSRAAWMG